MKFMPSCQNFKQKIEEFKKKTEELRFALSQYKNGQKEYLEIFEKDYGKLDEEIEEFRENEYAERVIEMTINWYHWEGIIDLVEFEKNGRLIIKESISIGGQRNNFLNLIKKIVENFFITDTDTDFKYADNLEVVVGNLDAGLNQTIESFKKLRTVGGNLDIGRSNLKSFDNLEEIGKHLGIMFNTNIKNINNFLDAFPKLKKIGKDVHNISIYCSNSDLKEQLLKLKEERRLEFNGEIEIE